MEKTYDFSMFDREIEIEALKIYIKQRHREMEQKAMEKYGSEYGPYMTAAFVSPELFIAYGLLKKLEREQKEAMDEYAERLRESNKKFIQNMFKFREGES